MSESKSRSTRAERIQRAQAKNAAEDAEVVIFLKTDNEQLNIQILPRDAEPDQESPAIILASFLNANMPALVQASREAYLAAQAPETQQPTSKPLRLISPNGGWVN